MFALTIALVVGCAGADQADIAGLNEVESNIAPTTPAELRTAVTPLSSSTPLPSVAPTAAPTSTAVPTATPDDPVSRVTAVLSNGTEVLFPGAQVGVLNGIEGVWWFDSHDGYRYVNDFISDVRPCPSDVYSVIAQYDGQLWCAWSVGRPASVDGRTAADPNACPGITQERVPVDVPVLYRNTPQRGVFAGQLLERVTDTICLGPNDEPLMLSDALWERRSEQHPDYIDAPDAPTETTGVTSAGVQVFLPGAEIGEIKGIEGVFLLKIGGDDPSDNTSLTRNPGCQLAHSVFQVGGKLVCGLPADSSGECASGTGAVVADVPMLIRGTTDETSLVWTDVCVQREIPDFG